MQVTSQGNSSSGLSLNKNGARSDGSLLPLPVSTSFDNPAAGKSSLQPAGIVSKGNLQPTGAAGKSNLQPAVIAGKRSQSSVKASDNIQSADTAGKRSQSAGAAAVWQFDDVDGSVPPSPAPNVG